MDPRRGSRNNYRRAFKAALAEASRPKDPQVDLTHLNPSGPHQGLRGTYATWLEDAGIPPRVIDELMGHIGGQAGSRVGLLYRETTAAMLKRVNAAMDKRLVRTLAAADELLMEMDEHRAARMHLGGPKKRRQAS